MEKINYTFIIPHKDIPDLLQRCLDSIPRREDIQIIVVDDNSDPAIVDFDHFPGLGEPCVEVYFTKEGKGAGYARNVGLCHAKGKWLLFADADDAFNSNCMLQLDSYMNSSFDIIYWGSNGVYEHSMKRSYRDYSYDIQYSYAKLKNDLYLYYFSIYQPWGKMIKKDLIVNNNIFFEEIKVSNDRMFSIKAVCHSDKIHYCSKKIYTSYNRSGSLVTLSSSIEDEIRLKSDIRLSKYLIENGFYRYHINLYLMIKTKGIKHGCDFFFKTINLLIKEFSWTIWLKDLYMLIIYEIPYFLYRKLKTHQYLKSQIIE